MRLRKYPAANTYPKSTVHCSNNRDEGLETQQCLLHPFCMKLYPATRTLLNRCSLNMSIPLSSMFAQHQEGR